MKEEIQLEMAPKSIRRIVHGAFTVQSFIINVKLRKTYRERVSDTLEFP